MNLLRALTPWLATTAAILAALTIASTLTHP